MHNLSQMKPYEFTWTNPVQTLFFLPFKAKIYIANTLFEKEKNNYITAIMKDAHYRRDYWYWLFIC